MISQVKTSARGSLAFPWRRCLSTQFMPVRPNETGTRPLRTVVQATSIVLGTVGAYVGFQLYQGKKVFLPMWISKSRWASTERDVDLKYVKSVAKEQVLERLSLDPLIQKGFRLPLKTQFHDEGFEIWTEEKQSTVKGIQLKPHPLRVSFEHRPFTVQRDFEVLMENLGGEDSFEIPVVNSNKSKDVDIWFLGTVSIEGQNGQVADVVFKGIFDSEHFRQARILKAHLIRDVDGHKTRETLWG